MAQTMRDMVKATVIQCVNIYQEHSEYPTFNICYHKTVFEILRKELKNRNLDAYVKDDYGIYELCVDLGMKNSTYVQLRISSLMNIGEGITPEIAADYFPQKSQLFKWRLMNINEDCCIDTDIDLPIEDYFTEALETCYLEIEYQTQLTLETLRKLLNAKETLLEVDSIRHADE